LTILLFFVFFFPFPIFLLLVIFNSSTFIFKRRGKIIIVMLVITDFLSSQESQINFSLSLHPSCIIPTIVILLLQPHLTLTIQFDCHQHNPPLLQ